MPTYRGFIVLGVSFGVLMLVFLLFVAFGWPGADDRCVTDTPHNTCYCEDFTPSDIGKAGVRQPVNTWFNLYAVLTSLTVAIFVYLDREAGTGRNLMRSKTWVPEMYIFVVLFLGLGSMWFHASLKGWGGNMDGVSMYVYAAFLTFYSLRRRLITSPLFFWIGYPVTALVFTIIHMLWSPHFEYASLVLILILVAAYLVVEAIMWAQTGKFMQGKPYTIVLWSLAVLSIVVATLFWVLSQTGGPLCKPTSGFQPHGMLWHPLAGVMAVLLYFYWRDASDNT